MDMATLSESNNYGYRQFAKDNSGSAQVVPGSDCLNTAEAGLDTTNASCSDTQNADDPVIDIVINNVVSSFSVRCHLNLRQIALNGFNVEYRRENGMLTMKIRAPNTTASIWSSGKITCTGATSEDDAKRAARKYARVLQKLGFRVRFANYRVVNVLGTCTMPFAIKLVPFSEKNRGAASYEPELHPGVTYKIKELRATLKIFSTGSITVTAPSVQNVQQAIEYIYPFVHEFRKERSENETRELKARKLAQRAAAAATAPTYHREEYDSYDDEEDDDDEDLMDYPDSDESWD